MAVLSFSGRGERELDWVGEVKRDSRRTGVPVGECEGRVGDGRG